MTKFPYQKGLAQAENMKFRQFCIFGFCNYVRGTKSYIFELMRCLHLDEIMPRSLWWYSEHYFCPPVCKGGAILFLIWKSY